MPHDTASSASQRRGYETALLIALVPIALTASYCIGHLDIPVARLVTRYLYASRGWSRYTASLPDALFILVVCVAAGSYALFRYRVARHGIDAPAIMYETLAVAAPVSFLAKSLLKFAFGRINTREWLLAPQEYGFHWFNGDARFSGFPSGHMVVFVALCAVVWRFHPRWRPACLALLLVLALALIATNYHFLSDVIVGAYVGLVAEAGTRRAVERAYRGPSLMNR